MKKTFTLLTVPAAEMPGDSPTNTEGFRTLVNYYLGKKGLECLFVKEVDSKKGFGEMILFLDGNRGDALGGMIIRWVKYLVNPYLVDRESIEDYAAYCSVILVDDKQYLIYPSMQYEEPGQFFFRYWPLPEEQYIQHLLSDEIAG